MAAERGGLNGVVTRAGGVCKVVAGSLHSRHPLERGCALRFELVDRVLERDTERLKAVKSVTAAEEYLADHFPGFAVLPGVMMLEALVQAARLLAEPSATSPVQVPLVVREVRNVRYGHMVRPGQSLELEVSLRGRDDEGTMEFHGRATVAGQLAAQGRFRLAAADALKRDLPAGPAHG